MILSGLEIKKRLGSDIHIDPFNENQLNPNSYNLKLHNKLMYYEDEVFDMKKELKTSSLIIPKEGLILKPNKLYLGRTKEHTKTQNLVPMLEARSSIGRLGLFVHITAGFGDIGFDGFWTLEIFCVQPIRIYSGLEICQIFYHTIDGDFDLYRSKKYQSNKGVQPSMLYKDFEENNE